MSPQTVQNQINELESLRSRTRMVRWGSTAAAILFTVVCVLVMRNSVQALFVEGPTQEQFVSKVQTNLQTTVVPELQSLAVQTVQDSRPIVETEITKLNDRVPQIAEATMTEFEKLQSDLPTRSEAVLDKHFGEMMKQREAKIKQMFPEATDEKIEAFLTNITDEGTTRLENINNKLFEPHIATMSNIADDMLKIEQIEAPYIKNEVPTWQMGLLLFDIARADLKGLEMPGLEDKAATGGGSSSGATKGTTKPATSGAAKPNAAKPATAPQSKGY